jgi:glycerol kinase
MRYVLALDQGTTSSRAILFDRDLAIRGLAQRELGQSFPRPGEVEHDPEEIWTGQLAVAREALARSGVRADELAAIGITNQRETTLVWERASGRPVAPAIVWQDRRTAADCARLVEQGHADLVRRQTGLVIDPYFSATKLAWLLDHVPDARRRAAAGELAFGTVDSWLAFRLSGGALHVTDASNASRTMLWDIHRGQWSDELLELFGVPRAMLPEVCESSAVLGTTEPELFGAALPIAGIAGDQQAALFGQLCLEPGAAKNTYGTGCFLLTQTGERACASRSGLLTTVAWRIGGRTSYALEGSVFIGGAVVQWLRDGLGLIRTAGEIEALARSVDGSDDVHFVPAFAGLGAPHWDPWARGTIVGLTRGTTAAHLARAALESIAFQVCDLAAAIEADTGRPIAELRVDGGAAANDLLLEMQADLLERAVVRSRVTETTALGAAFLAGLATGVWPDAAALRATWASGGRFEPRLEPAAAARRRARWAQAVERARGWARDGAAR